MQTRRPSLAALSLLLLTICLLAGCASTRVDWQSRIGTYTFDNAVLELGPPDKQATLQDGRLVAEWLTDRGGTVIYPSYSMYRGHPYGYSPMPTDYVNTPDYFLRLTFDAERRLTDWKQVAR